MKGFCNDWTASHQNPSPLWGMGGGRCWGPPLCKCSLTYAEHDRHEPPAARGTCVNMCTGIMGLPKRCGKLCPRPPTGRVLQGCCTQALCVASVGRDCSVKAGTNCTRVAFKASRRLYDFSLSVLSFTSPSVCKVSGTSAGD